MAKHIFLSPSNQNANIGYGSYGNEMQRMVELCNILGPILERCGFKVSRQDSLSPIGGRTAWANKNAVDLYVPVHSNAGGGSGPIVGHHRNSANGIRAAQFIQKFLNSDMPLRDNGTTSAWNFGEINNTSMPCAYIECFFHDNKTDVEWYLSGDNKKIVAEAIAKGICEYFGVAFVGGSTPVPVDDAKAPDGMIYRLYSSKWAGASMSGALAYKSVSDKRSYIALCADGKYRVYVPSGETTSSAGAAKLVNPDGLVRLEAISI